MTVLTARFKANRLHHRMGRRYVGAMANAVNIGLCQREHRTAFGCSSSLRTGGVASTDNSSLNCYWINDHMSRTSVAEVEVVERIARIGQHPTFIVGLRASPLGFAEGNWHKTATLLAKNLLV